MHRNGAGATPTGLRPAKRASGRQTQAAGRRPSRSRQAAQPAGEGGQDVSTAQRDESGCQHEAPRRLTTKKRVRARIVSLLHWRGRASHRDFESVERDGYAPVLDAVVWLASRSDQPDVAAFEDAERFIIQKAEAGDVAIWGFKRGCLGLQRIPAADFSGVKSNRIGWGAYLELIGPADDAQPHGGRYQDKLYLDGDEQEATWSKIRVENVTLRGAVAAPSSPLSEAEMMETIRQVLRQAIRDDPSCRTSGGKQKKAVMKILRTMKINYRKGKGELVDRVTEEPEFKAYRGNVGETLTPRASRRKK